MASGAKGKAVAGQIFRGEYGGSSMTSLPAGCLWGDIRYAVEGAHHGQGRRRQGAFKNAGPSG